MSKPRESISIDKYIEIARKNPRLADKIELECAKKAKGKGKDKKKYKEKLFNSTTGLVINTARKYASHCETFEDLIGEGMKGLEHALKLYDPKRKVRFSTYAQWWVRSYIRKFFSDNVRGFKVPEAVCERLYHLNQKIEKLSKTLARDPTNEELADETGLSKKYVQFLRKYLMPHFTLDAQVVNRAGRPFSTIGENLSENDRDNASESLIRVDGINKIKDAVEKLAPDEKFVIQNRYGLNDCDDQTLAEVGKRMNLTAERVRQIQVEAEKRLKSMVNK